ncbi:chaperone modulator CbpM [Pseudonocardia bannensis]|uniref:MerR family transcriptional regulator n=1 Tax=Pseudonocardia bannensis TaxID=630973 RepID=A0A848DJ39_9PSEU|nr:chaperone modulator CbpM [Pseudonocardia bannensis]NMH92722.1 MerR family transcriptional regulator [Pseudonocardia bannensis]
MTVQYLPVAQQQGLTQEDFARRSGVHPELLRRFVALGLIRATRDTNGDLRFPREQLTTMARIQRLRAGLPLNYAALGLVIDLLDRIQDLETVARRSRIDDRRSVTWT